MRLSSKIAFVTAAGQGIGRATAEAFVHEGARVVAADINDAALADLARATGCTTLELDVTDAAAVAAAAQEAGDVDVLFNAVGYVHSGRFSSATRRVRLFHDLNVRAMYRSFARFCRACWPRAAGRSQHVVRVGVSEVSQSLRLRRHQGGRHRPDQVDRRGFRHARHPLQRHLSGHRGFAVAGRSDRRASQGQHQAEADVRAAFVSRQPMGRIGHAEEIAALAVYLASDESAFTTGTIHVIDGGWSN